jgi:NAD-dependent SIR2 family protein deacetylase
VCSGLFQPLVVWFGECMEEGILECAHNTLKDYDLLLVINTSIVVQVLQFATILFKKISMHVYFHFKLTLTT